MSVPKKWNCPYEMWPSSFSITIPLKYHIHYKCKTKSSNYLRKVISMWTVDQLSCKGFVHKWVQLFMWLFRPAIDGLSLFSGVRVINRWYLVSHLEYFCIDAWKMATKVAIHRESATRVLGSFLDLPHFALFLFLYCNSINIERNLVS